MTPRRIAGTHFCVDTFEAFAYPASAVLLR